VHTGGLFGLVFCVLPSFDVVSSVLLLNASMLLVPSLLQLSRVQSQRISFTADIISVIVSISALMTWMFLSIFLPVKEQSHWCKCNFTDSLHNTTESWSFTNQTLHNQRHVVQIQLFNTDVLELTGFLLIASLTFHRALRFYILFPVLLKSRS
jgi:hypothetical protein